jgi:hypothetical protein
VAPSITTVVTYGVLGLVGLRLVSGARVGFSSAGRTTSLLVVRRISWRHLWPIPIVLTAVLVAAIALMSVPGLSWGWWSALGGDGNPVFGSSDATSGSALEWIIPIAFVALLLPALPLFAMAEERMFRAGAEHWSWGRRALKTLSFGLIHAVIGIPIGAALALAIGGAYFMAVYLRRFAATGSSTDAVYESSAAHTAYNATIIVLVITVLAVDAGVRAFA